MSMEPKKCSSLTRKPLSDRTNTVANTRRNSSSSPAKSASTAACINDQEKPKLSTVYDQRKAPRRRKCAGVEIMLSLSCPPRKKKMTEVEIVIKAGAKQSGSRANPPPVHEKVCWKASLEKFSNLYTGYYPAPSASSKTPSNFLQFFQVLTELIKDKLKKGSRKKQDGSTEEEIERLKAYYADIDAFELPEEEVASERDLD